MVRPCTVHTPSSECLRATARSAGMLQQAHPENAPASASEVESSIASGNIYCQWQHKYVQLVKLLLFPLKFLFEDHIDEVKLTKI